MRLLRNVLFVGFVGLVSGFAEAATYTWVGTTANVLDPLNWSGSVPTSVDDAVFDAAGSTSPDVSGAWSVLNLRFASSPAYTFVGTGGITFPVGGSIDTGAATGNILFNNGGLSFTRAAGINATGAANITVSATTPFVMGIGGTNADPYLNAIGGDITINSLVDFTLAAARRNLICAPSNGRTITLAGGVSPTTTTNRLGNVYVRGEAGGKVILGNSTTWAGWTDIYEGDLEINHNDSLGVAGSMGGAYFGGTQWLGTAGSLLLTNNITSPEGMYLTGRGTSTSGIKNKSGHNTLSGVLGGGGGAAGDTMYNFESVGTAGGDLLEISGIIQPTTWNTGAYTVALRGAGPGLISGTISSTVLAVNTGTFDGGTLGVTKFDGGTWTLTNANTYTGPTTIASGTLALSGAGSIGTSPLIDVRSGATLNVSNVAGAVWTLGSTQTIKGKGTVVGNILAAAGSIIEPGESPGILAVTGNLDMSAGSMTWELAALVDDASPGTPGTDYDLTTVSGALTLGGTSKLTLNLSAVAAPDPLVSFWQSNHSWKVIDVGSSGSTAGNFVVLADGGPYTTAGTFSTTVDGSGDVFLTFAAVPEPATWMLMLLGVLTICGWRRLRNR